MPMIFVSHSNEDTAETAEVVQALRQANYSVWVDYDNIRGGQEWLCEIQAGITRCDALVALLSEASVESLWVERECLYAMQLQKPILTALIADVLIPLHLIAIQHCDLRQGGGMRKLLESLQAGADLQDRYVPAVISHEPVAGNFFPYLAQLPRGGVNSRVARGLYEWARGQGAELGFGGSVKPVMHVRVRGAGGYRRVFSVWAYRRQPAIEVPLDALATQLPFQARGERLALLGELNRLLPASAQFPPAFHDRRPTFALQHLADAPALAAFQRLALRIMTKLRAAA